MKLKLHELQVEHRENLPCETPDADLVTNTISLEELKEFMTTGKLKEMVWDFYWLLGIWENFRKGGKIQIIQMVKVLVEELLKWV